MDTRQLIDDLVADLDPMARPLVTGYLRELAAVLPGSRRTREAILTEIADGLIEHVTNTTGPDPATAVETAIRTFGDPRNLAHQFANELTGKTAHRTGVALVGSGPLIGTCWLLALTSGQPPAMTVTLPQRIAGMLSALPLIPVLLLIIIPAALVAVAGAGRASRILPVTSRTAGFAALFASRGCVVADLVLIAHALTAAQAWSPLLVAAIVFSTARLSLAAAAARRCAQLGAAG